MGLITTSDGGGQATGALAATPGRVERRVLDAALRCLARWGVAKTTLDDIAREADVSRATVYRAFPGGKDTVLDAIVADELARFGSELALRLAGADDLESLLVTGVTYASRTLTGHDALQYLLVHEPEQVLPHVSFGRYDQVLAAAAQLVAPHLARFVGEGLAARTGEWVTRLVLSYTLAPSPFYDLTDEDDVRRFVRSYLLPGLTPSAPSATQS
jgi:AcrR family transcriptional regulator